MKVKSPRIKKLESWKLGGVDIEIDKVSFETLVSRLGSSGRQLYGLTLAERTEEGALQVEKEIYDQFRKLNPDVYSNQNSHNFASDDEMSTINPASTASDPIYKS